MALQAFLGLLEWDEQRLVDLLQQHVALNHPYPWGADPQRIRALNAMGHVLRDHFGDAQAVRSLW